MRFRLEQPIAAPAERVLAAFTNPSFYPSLGRIGGIAPPEVVAWEDDGTVVSLRVRYAFNGQVSPVVARVIDPRKLTWVEESAIDREERLCRFTMLPEHYPDRLECSGQYLLRPEGTETVQVLEGDLRVRYPVVGPVVERAIVMGMRQHMGEEAKLVQEWAARD